MPDRPPLRRLFAALALAGGLTFTISGVALAGGGLPPQWAGSSFDPAVTAVHVEHEFDIGGIFKHSDANARIFGVEVDFEWGSYPSPGADGCRIPRDVSNAPEIDPDFDPESPAEPPPPPSDAPTNEFRFLLANRQWPCNGTYSVEATATSSDPQEPIMPATIRVAVPPVPVPSMEATVVGGKDAPDPKTGATVDDPASVDVTWEQIGDPTQYPDFVGYRVQRAGPEADASFETVSGVTEHGSTGNFTDTIEAPGEYRYRVQSLRAGPEGPTKPVPSVSNLTPAVSVTVAGPPATTTTTSTTEPIENDATTTERRTFGLPEVDRTRSNPGLSVPAPTTTVDPGFDGTLDYGEFPEPGSELAGEGQSVIQTEGEGAGLLGPVAGAMVLVGWAGHVAYLNRLAKQF